MNKFSEPKVQKKIKVKATNEFKHYRLVQFRGLDKHQFRKLKEGETIEINKSAYEFNKSFLKEVK